MCPPKTPRRSAQNQHGGRDRKGEAAVQRAPGTYIRIQHFSTKGMHQAPSLVGGKARDGDGV